MIRKRIRFHGLVQGVGFRYRSIYAAQQIGCTGWVRNESTGDVTMEIQGTEEQIDRVIQTLDRSPYIHIRSMDVRTLPIDEDERDFIAKEDWWY